MRRLMAIVLVGMGIMLSIPQWSGAQWVQASNPEGGWITSLVVSGENLFASTRKGGVFLSSDKGTSWKPVNSGFPKKIDVQCLAVSGMNLFAGTVGQGVFLSTDNGITWKAVNSGMPANKSVWRLVVSGTNLFAAVGPDGRATVYRSDDNGASWTPANSGLQDTNVMCLAVSGTNLFAGAGVPFSSKPGGVFLSTDNGASWKAVNSGLPDKEPIFRLAVSGTNLFAGTWAMGRVFLSTDNGTSWTEVSSGLPHPMLFSLSDLVVSRTNLFLGSFAGVFLSTNNGTSWTAINSGLPTEGNSVYSLVVSETDLFAGTEEGKVWRFPLSDLSLALNLSEPVFSDGQWEEIRKRSPNAVIIPKGIEAAMEEGLAARQGRQDIPFTIFKCLYSPAQRMPGLILLYPIDPAAVVQLAKKAYAAKDFLHAVLFFKAKNANLGYALKAKTLAEKEKDLPLSTSIFQAHLNVFIEFRQTDESGNSKVVRELFVPASLEEESETYDPDREDWYSIGYILRPGKYTAVMAITPRTAPSTETSAIDDLNKVGVSYFDIDLPGPESYQAGLELTPVFFVKKVEQMKEREMVTKFHKGMFTWSNIQVVPNIDYFVSPGERIEIFYCILGAKPIGEPGEQAKYGIESAYEVQKEDGTLAILWDVQNYDVAFISQSLHLKQTVRIKDEQGERKEQRDLIPGKYILVIKVKDNVSGLTAEKKVPFEVK